MSKFKPCPFCGCSVPPAVQGNGIGDNWLECTECGASTRLREDGAGIEKDWNRRAARATAEQSVPMAWMRTYRQFSEHPIEPDPGYLVTSFHQNADYAAKHPAENVPLYAAPQPSHNRDSVIEECALSYENFFMRHESTTFGYVIDGLRALKSQQDAAIESKPAEHSVDALDAARYRWLSKRVVITDGSTPGLMVITAVDDGFEYGNQFLDEFTEAALAATESQRSGDGS